MKVVDKKTFLTLPEGTFFCKGCQWSFYDLCVKGETLSEFDFRYINLCILDMGNGSEDYVDNLENSLKNNISYKLELGEMRDGTYDYNDIFLIYEKKDLLVIKEYIDKYLQQ